MRLRAAQVRIVWWAFAVCSLAAPALGLENVQFLEDGIEHAVAGQVLVEAQDGGLLLEGRDGVIWVIQPDQLRQRSQDAEAFTRLDRQALTQQLQTELPADFRWHSTANYLIGYNTSKAYAQWCGALFERLHRAFYNFWEAQGLKLQPAPPLVAVVYRDRTSYLTQSRPELGEAADAIIGYYSLRTNRITTYDLTGIERLRNQADRIGTQKHITQILSRPEAERTVATVIHEATHQLTFNSGMLVRFADNPLWISEGLAIYFESPDLSSTKGWRKIGSLNEVRLQRMRDYLARRIPGSLPSLITSDARFRDTAQADDAYAEAWALTYHLIRSQPAELRRYLQCLAAKPPLGQDSAEARLRDFQESFRTELATLEVQLLRAVEQW